MGQPLNCACQSFRSTPTWSVQVDSGVLPCRASGAGTSADTLGITLGRIAAMAEYRLLESFAHGVRRRTLRMLLPLSLLAGGVGLGISYIQSGSVAGATVAIPLTLAVVLFSTYRGYQRQLQQARSLVIIVSDDAVTLRMDGLQERTIARPDVVRIDEHESGELTVVSRNRRESIRVPRETEHREQLKRELSRLGNIQASGGIQADGWSTVTGAATLLAFAITMLSSDKWIVAIVGSLLSVGLLLSAWLIRRNVAIDARTRRLAILVVLPAAVVIARVVAVLRGG